MDLYKNHLDTEAQFEGAMFTHPTRSINLGPRKSAYTILESMNDKIDPEWEIIKSLKVSAKDTTVLLEAQGSVEELLNIILGKK